MPASEFGVALLLTVVVLALVAAAYVVLASELGRRAGTRWLPAAWLGATALYVVHARLRLPARLDLEVLPSQVLIMLVLSWVVQPLLAFGFASLVVRRRLTRAPAARTSAGDVARGVGAFLLGVALVLLVVAVADVGDAIIAVQ